MYVITHAYLESDDETTMHHYFLFNKVSALNIFHNVFFSDDIVTLSILHNGIALSF